MGSNFRAFDDIFFLHFVSEKQKKDVIESVLVARHNIDVLVEHHNNIFILIDDDISIAAAHQSRPLISSAQRSAHDLCFFAYDTKLSEQLTWRAALTKLLMLIWRVYPCLQTLCLLHLCPLHLCPNF